MSWIIELAIRPTAESLSFFTISRAIRNLISEGHTVREIRAKAAEEKMLEFRHAALLKVAAGATSPEEVFRAIPTEHLVAED